MGTLLALASGLGLASATGLNAFLPLLTIGILSRFGLITLATPFDLLAHPLVLLIIAALAALDFVGDKVPAVDSMLHALGLVIAPVAGAVVALAARGDVAQVNPVLVAVAGLVAAGTTHMARTSARPVFTAATGGTANPVVSIAEDGTALLLSVLAIVAPVLAIILLAVLAFVLVRALRGAVSVWRERGSNGRVHVERN